MKRQVTDCRYICKLYICCRICIKKCKNAYTQQTTKSNKTRAQFKKVLCLTVWPFRPTTDPLLIHLPGSHVYHVWFLHCQCYEESGSTAPAGGWAQQCESFPHSSKCEIILSAEFLIWFPLLTGVSLSRNPFRTPKLCSFL